MHHVHFFLTYFGSEVHVIEKKYFSLLNDDMPLNVIVFCF